MLAFGLRWKRVGGSRVDVFPELRVPVAALPDGVRKNIGGKWNRNGSRSCRHQRGEFEDFGESWSRGDVDGPHQALIAVRATLILGRFERILRIIF